MHARENESELSSSTESGRAAVPFLQHDGPWVMVWIGTMVAMWVPSFSEQCIISCTVESALLYIFVSFFLQFVIGYVSS